MVLFSKLRRYLRISGANEIARRYLVMNGFDGALVTLGLIMGSYVTGIFSPRLIVGAGIGASTAMAISGAWGAFLAERAERSRKLQELEDAMFTQLNNTVLRRASLVATIFVAAVDAFAPLATALISLSPFFLALHGFINADSALVPSLILNMATLFTLGIFLGKVSRSNVILQGAIMVLAGLITAGLLILIGTAT